MKLHELKSLKPRLNEEDVELKQPEDLWDENEKDVKTFISDTVYDVKKLDGGVKYEVSVEQGTERKPFSTVSKQELDKSFVQTHPNSTPDAEGYVQYRSSAEVEAIQYDGEPVKVQIDGKAALLNSGDYLSRSVDGNDFKYEVRKAKDFEALYAEK